MKRRIFLQLCGTMFAAVSAGCNESSKNKSSPPTTKEKSPTIKTNLPSRIRIWNRNISKKEVNLTITYGNTTVLRNEVVVDGKSNQIISLNSPSASGMYTIKATLVHLENQESGSSLIIQPQEIESNPDPVVVIGNEGQITVHLRDDGLRPVENQTSTAR